MIRTAPGLLSLRAYLFCSAAQIVAQCTIQSSLMKFDDCGLSIFLSAGPPEIASRPPLMLKR